MFDVASGECELVDFLLTRFDPIDLKTKIKFDPTAQVDEQLAPPKEEEAVPLVPDKPDPEPVPLQLNLKMPPPPGAPAPAADPGDGYRAAAAEPPGADDQALFEAPEDAQPETSPAPGSQDWLALYHQRFQEAAQRYQEELGPTKNEKDETE
ncbi:MAG: hypothetical protein KF760_22325 [Candidatus Eremiobacteraeota bacterium]|nr:hypothetical protein [Candidatus Eremiobacteraeota bacterium]MCW5866437.1 hypothetical protein [Candidatus Eremiobacteraeota bacterium]